MLHLNDITTLFKKLAKLFDRKLEFQQFWILLYFLGKLLSLFSKAFYLALTLFVRHKTKEGFIPYFLFGMIYIWLPWTDAIVLYQKSFNFFPSTECGVVEEPLPPPYP